MLGQLHTFDTVSAFVKDMREPHQGDSYWMGGMTARQAVQAAVTGDEAAVVGAERFMDKIEHSLELPETVGLQTVRSPFGGRADMGAWLAGSPEPMRRRARRANDVGPVKIVVGSFVSSGIDADTLKRRGEAIIAFLMLVQRIRPVDLYILGESTHTGRDGWRNYYIRLESRPVSLSQIGFVIGHPAFFRALGNGWFQDKNPSAPGVPILQSTVAEQRERLGLEPQDILIEKAALYDLLVSDPVAWIKRELAKITS